MLTRRAALGTIAGGLAAATGTLRIAGAAPPSPFGALQRVSNLPLLSPVGTGFESAGVFNPSAMRTKDGIVLLYRAQDARGTSTIGYAVSKDGVHFERRAKPVLTPEAPYEYQGGVEDPRLVSIAGTYYLTYTGYNSVEQSAQLCLATSTDLIHWDRHGVILPAYRGRWNTGWTKSGAIVPQKINGRWWMYYLGEGAYTNDIKPGEMGLAYSDDLLHWTDATSTSVLPARPRMFDSNVVEPGPAPIVTDEGILLIYNGADGYLVYSTGWALFDKKDPSKVLARSETPLFGAYLPWERTGQVPNVVFVEGMIVEGSDLTFYYGAGDKMIGSARTRLRWGTSAAG
jgi:beta-1,2-mannosidase